MKLPQSWWWELKLRREGSIIESKKERGRQIKAAGQIHNFQELLNFPAFLKAFVSYNK